MVWSLRSFGPTHGRVISTAVVLGLGVVLTTCSIDRNLVNSLAFKCFSDDDCVGSYFCDGATGDEPGTCVTFGGPDGGDCFDRDEDSFVAGQDCRPDQAPFDCNDDNALIFPGAEESCNNIDDDCNGTADDGIDPRPCDLQVGVCFGALAQCVNGAFQNCATEGLYGADFEDVADAAESCDGLDNNCSGGYPTDATPLEIDAQCDCIPGFNDVDTCQTEVGACRRGITFCQPDGSFTACVLAELGDGCASDEECGADGFCLTESIDQREDLTDDCVTGNEAACTQQVCRTLTGTSTCSSDNDCGLTEACVHDACQVVAQGNSQETCNGVDDDCNGRIDEGGICTPCPFGMILLDGVPGNPLGLCMDANEASRPDASDTSAGANTFYATNSAGVLPWTGVDSQEADEACQGTAINSLIAGAVTRRRLCRGTELEFACGNTYPYGSTYTEGQCNDSSTGAALEPTGSYSACCVGGICDLSGNAAEVVSSPFEGVFGGSAAENDSNRLSCETNDIGALDTNFIGFRCCAVPTN